MPDQINILHITDLHVPSCPPFNQTLILEALCADVQRERGKGIKFDLCVFSGDLALSAAEEEYQHSLDLLLKVLDAAELTENHLILCPGNHDAARDVIGPRLPDLAEFREAASSRDGMNALADSDSFRCFVASAFGNYGSIAEHFCCDSLIYSDPFCTAHAIRGATVVSINTAILTGAGLSHDFEDQGMLAFPEKSLVMAFAKCPRTAPIYVVGHHPLEWMGEVHSNLIQSVLAEHAKAYFCGHLHHPNPRVIETINGGVFIAQSGALYGHRDYWNGYAVISAAPGNIHFRVSFRRWWEDRREFSHAEDLADRGVFYSSNDALRFWKSATPELSNVNSAALEEWRVCFATSWRSGNR